MSETMPSPKSEGEASESLSLSANFPAGLNVMVVDDDPLCLKVIEQMLRRCNYRVTTCQSSTNALGILRDTDNNHFDLVLSDVYMPDMDGFKLLEIIGLELGLPVIMMSSNGETSVVFRGVTHGAVDFLIKPVRIEELRNLWQHVVRKTLPEDGVGHGAGHGVGHGRRPSRAGDQPSQGDGGRCSLQSFPLGDRAHSEEDGEDSRQKGDRKRKDVSRLGAPKDEGDGSSAKKPRVVWSVEMHQQFVNAVNQLGIDKAVPKRILDLMNVEGLTRENVASHLQKYRLYLKRVAGISTTNSRNGKGSRTDQAGSLSGMNGSIPMGGMPPHMMAQDLLGIPGMPADVGPRPHPFPMMPMPALAMGMAGMAMGMQLPPGMGGMMMGPPPMGTPLLPSQMAALSQQQHQQVGVQRNDSMPSPMSHENSMGNSVVDASAQSFTAMLNGAPPGMSGAPLDAMQATSQFTAQHVFGAAALDMQQQQSQQQAGSMLPGTVSGGGAGQSDLAQMCSQLDVNSLMGMAMQQQQAMSMQQPVQGGDQKPAEADDLFQFLLKDSNLID